jgi:hypothetical protein
MGELEQVVHALCGVWNGVLSIFKMLEMEGEKMHDRCCAVLVFRLSKLPRHFCHWSGRINFLFEHALALTPTIHA